VPSDTWNADGDENDYAIACKRSYTSAILGISYASYELMKELIAICSIDNKFLHSTPAIADRSVGSKPSDSAVALRIIDVNKTLWDFVVCGHIFHVATLHLPE
jgi:hypothetical protein